MITLANNTAQQLPPLTKEGVGPAPSGVGSLPGQQDPAALELKESALFNRVFPAIVFITRNENIPERVQTEATMAAVKVIEQHRPEQLQETLERRAKEKMRK